MAVSQTEHSSVDEMMVCYKDKTCPIRVYLKGKPHPWGIKIWVLATDEGLVLAFEVFGAETPEQWDLTASSSVVFRLALNYKVYADNYFTSVDLAQKLIERGIRFAGTIRPARTYCKDLAKSGRGSCTERVLGEENSVVLVKWSDNSSVHLLSSYVGVGQCDEARRYERAIHMYINVPRPEIVSEYNRFMGGIDLMNSFLAKYRYRMKSRRWYLYLFWQFVMVSVVNAWLLYRRDCKIRNIAKKK
jgi:hypothetical protein